VLELAKPAALAELLEVAQREVSDLGEIAQLAVITGARRGELCAHGWPGRA
jgi:hypothetical protein